MPLIIMIITIIEKNIITYIQVSYKLKKTNLSTEHQKSLTINSEWLNTRSEGTVVPQIDRYLHASFDKSEISVSSDAHQTALIACCCSIIFSFMENVEPHRVATSERSLCSGNSNNFCFSSKSLFFFQLQWNKAVSTWHLYWILSSFRLLVTARSKLCPKQLIWHQSRIRKARNTLLPLSVMVATRLAWFKFQLSRPSVIASAMFSPVWSFTSGTFFQAKRT